jgi:hypothetical protein
VQPSKPAVHRACADFDIFHRKGILMFDFFAARATGPIVSTMCNTLLT